MLPMAKRGRFSLNPPQPRARRVKELSPILLLLLLVMLVGGAALPASASDGSDDASEYPGQPGAVRVTAGGFTGTYTSGDLPREDSVISEFAVGGARLLQSISVGGYEQMERSIEASSVEVEGTNAKLELADTPAAYMRLELRPGAAATIVPDAQASVSSAGTGSFRIASGSASGLIWADCEGASLVLGDGSLNLGPSEHDCKLLFRADTGAHPISQSDLDDALSGGVLAAEVTVEGDGTYEMRHVESFEPVEVQVQASDGHLLVALSGNVTGPRSVVILLPDRVLPDGDSLSATMDGRTMEAAASTAIALSATAGGENGSFARSSSGNVEAVVLSVPHFSVHIVELSVARGPAAGPLSGVQPIAIGDAALPMVLAAVATVGAAVILVRRPGN